MLGSRLFLRPATARSLATFVPLLGGVWRWTSLAEFCHLLALLLEHRLPMPEALRLAGEGVQDSRIESTTRSMAEAVEDGKTLAQAMASRGVFPPRLPRLLRWAENQGSLPEVLHMAGDMFAARASAHSSLRLIRPERGLLHPDHRRGRPRHPRVDAPHDQPDQQIVRMIVPDRCSPQSGEPP